VNRLLALLILICLGSVPAFSQGTIVTLRPGDTFEMRLGGVPPELAVDFNITYMVSQEGFVNVPLIGKTRAGGLTPPQLETEIQTKLVADKLFTHPSVNINPAPGTRFISIGGGVRAPQRLPWTADLTLGSAIQIAGGLSDFGSPKGIRLIREGKATIFDLRNFDKDPSLDPRLLPGDQIIVRQ
jgi:polysaccharide export outer membrane protein